MRHSPSSLLLLTAALACGSPEFRTREARAVDSVIPREEALRRFREGLTPVTTLANGAPDRETLVRRFVSALETRDTASLKALLVTRAEFAYLYYPNNPQSLPPYDLSPDLMWFVLEQESNKGFFQLLENRGGSLLGYLSHTCERADTGDAPYAVWAPCVVRRLQAPGDTIEERLFGPIVHVGATWKLVSLANKL